MQDSLDPTTVTLTLALAVIRSMIVLSSRGMASSQKLQENDNRAPWREATRNGGKFERGIDMRQGKRAARTLGSDNHSKRSGINLRRGAAPKEGV